MTPKYTALTILLTAWVQFSAHSLRRKSLALQNLEKSAPLAYSFRQWLRLPAMLKLGIWSNTRGQDLIEYALMAGLVTLAAIAAVPGIATSISTVLSKVASAMTAAASTS